MVYSLSFSEGFWSEETRVMHWKQNGRYPVSSVVSTVIKETSTRVQFSTEQVFASSFLEQTVGKWERYCINLMAHPVFLSNSNGDILSFFEVN